MTAIQWISKEAKAIRKKQPSLSWSECIKIASALYKSKHKTTTTKKKIGAVKYVEKGEPKSAKAKKVYQVNRTKKGTYKSITRIAGTSTHKDTKSHNVNVRVVSGITPNEYALHEIKIHIKKRDEAIKGIEKWSNMAKSTKIIATKKEYNKYLNTYKKLVLYHSLQIKKLKDSIK